MIEIGTADYGSLFLFTHRASEDATIISIDLPGGKFGGGHLKWKIPLYKAFKSPNQELHLIRADSHDKNLREGRIYLVVDFLFIDDYTYEVVKKDFEMYGLLVNEGT
ncbi:MAG: hypothetical protein OCU16_06525 [Candidatus Methanospirare jalkutatii]|nr:hypothetical protein [Candidatus Methanospirare jalkutatii]